MNRRLQTRTEVQWMHVVTQREQHLTAARGDASRQTLTSCTHIHALKDGARAHTHTHMSALQLRTAY